MWPTYSLLHAPCRSISVTFEKSATSLVKLPSKTWCFKSIMIWLGSMSFLPSGDGIIEKLESIMSICKWLLPSYFAWLASGMGILYLLTLKFLTLLNKNSEPNSSSSCSYQTPSHIRVSRRRAGRSLYRLWQSFVKLKALLGKNSQDIFSSNLFGSAAMKVASTSLAQCSLHLHLMILNGSIVKKRLSLILRRKSTLFRIVCGFFSCIILYGENL